MEVEGARRDFFFKMYMPECSSQRMLVPRGFLALQDRPLSGEILLRRPEGREWRVKAISEGEDVYIEDGRPEFVRDNAVEKYDMMVFYYQGQGALKVVLYGGDSGREKEECACPEEVGAEVDVLDCKGITDDGDDDEEEEEDVDVWEGNCDADVIEVEEEEEEEEDVDVWEGNGDADVIEVEEEDIDVWEGNSDADVIEVEEEEEEDEDEDHEEGTVRERKAADEDQIDVERYVNLRNPFFVTRIQTVRNSALYIPCSVVVNYKLQLPQGIEFKDPKGRTWKGRVKVWKDSRIWIKGWGALCRRNNVKKEDHCICEFLQEGGVTSGVIKIHIVRGDGA